MFRKDNIERKISDIEKLRNFGSATIADAVKINMEKISNNLLSQPINYTGPEIKSLLPQLGPVAGKIVTAEITTNDPDSEGLHWDDYYDVLDRTKEPIISIIKDIDTKTGRGASFGDEMAAINKALGVHGVVIDGTIRDIEGINEVGLPIWGKGLVPGHGAFKLIRVNSPITVGQLLVTPFELMVADSNGCTKIPNNHKITDILKNASTIAQKENSLHEKMKKPGFTLSKYKAWIAQNR